MGIDIQTRSLRRPHRRAPRTLRSESCCGFRRRSRPARPAPARASRNRRRARTGEASAPPRPHRAPAIRMAFARSRCSSSVCILRERHEDGANRSLARAQRKLAELVAREHLAHGQPHAAADIFFPAVQRLGWNRRRVLHAQNHRLARRRQRAPPQALRSAAPRSRPGPSHARGRGSARSDRRRHTPARATRGARSPAPRRTLRRRAAARPRSNAPASCSRKNPCDTTTRSALPSRCRTRSRRLARTDTPTINAPASTATAMATPPMTARFVRQ